MVTVLYDAESAVREKRGKQKRGKGEKGETQRGKVFSRFRVMQYIFTSGRKLLRTEYSSSLNIILIMMKI